jgi:hypothetical protein
MATVKPLSDFLAEHAICRVWAAGVGFPAGDELALNVDTDVEEDYCCAEQLLDLPYVRQASEAGVAGTVTQDADGEWRWDVDSLQDVNLTDEGGCTVYNLVVWGE